MPTICSTCHRTSGKCEACIKVDAMPPDQLRAFAIKAMQQTTWQPIETAPKDKKIMAFCPKFGVVGPVRWEEQKYHSRPRPYWSHWGEGTLGKTWVRDDQPTHWMPLPTAPEAP